MHYILFFLIVVLTSCCSDKGQRMAQVLDDADRHNQNYEPLTDDTLLREAAAYYDSWGTCNEQLRAHYLLGCYYRDLGAAPEALAEYHAAVECADTTQADCDYHTLSRVHSQMAQLFCDQLLPEETLMELDETYKYARLDHDTITWLLAYELKNLPYNQLQMHDSAIAVLEKSSLMYRKYGYKAQAAQCLGTLVLYQSEHGYLSEAKKNMELFEHESGLFHDGNIIQGRELYYYYKAEYFVKAQVVDSAEYYLRKLSACCTDGNSKEAVYKGLYEVYLQRNIRDSIAKYASLSYEVNDENFRTLSADELRRMHALYNYSLQQQVAQKQTMEARRNRSLFYMAILVSIIICLYAYHYINKQKKAKMAQLNQLRVAYHNNLEQIEKDKNDLLKMKGSEYQALIQEKEMEIMKRQSTIDSLGLLFKSEEKQPLEHRLVNTKAYQRFKFLATHPLEKVKVADWKVLRQMIETELPDFYATLHGGHRISEDDYNFCILIRLHFSPSEISVLTNMLAPNISRKSKNLLKKWYGIDGKPEDFYHLVKSIK